MKPIFKKGDIFKGDEYFKVHQVNCMGAMGAGIAKQVRTKYPKVYIKYVKACNTNEKKSLLGKIQVVDTGCDFSIINLFGQYDYNAKNGRNTDYEAFYCGLEKIRDYVLKCDEPKEVAFPYRIASALAGGDWNVILSMIESVFNDTDIKVSIYEL